MRRWVPYILFFGGLLIDFVAMFGEYADQIPFVTWAIAPSYYHAQRGFKTLKQEGSLDSKSEGYDEISKIISEHEASQIGLYISDTANGVYFNTYTDTFNSSLLPQLSIENFKEENGLFTAARGKIVVDAISFDLHSKTFAFLENNQHDFHCNWREGEMQAEIDQLKTPNILFFVFGSFFVGSTLAIMGFIMDRKESANRHGM